MQEINELVTTVRDGQQKMWGAIERTSKDLQELIQKDARADGEGDEDPVPVTTKLDIVKTAPARMGLTGTPSFCCKGIPKEDESSV